MLTDQALNRMSDAFRRGYSNGIQGEDSKLSEYKKGTFAHSDYENGFVYGSMIRNRFNLAQYE
jgi:ribosome modulation factor